MQRSPVELTIAVDASLALPGADVFAACRDALHRSMEAIQDDDRVSIVLASQRPVSLAKGLGPQDSQELAAAIEQIRPQPIVDMVPAIEAAIGQAGRSEDTRRKVVICLTSGLGHVTDSERQRLSELVASAAQRGVRFEVVCVAPWDGPDATSAELAASGAGEVHHAADGREIWAVLYRLSAAESPIAAENVALNMEFDPQVVESYRVIGHDFKSMDLVDAGNVHGVELQLGQSSVAVLEVKLKEAASGTVGTVHLTWRDPQTGTSGEATRRVSTAEFATTLAESALPLQRAAVAAMTAEILRRVKYAPADARLDDVLKLADMLDDRLWGEPWFVDLVGTIEAALTHARPSRDRPR
jgi:Ca-activated chloride channel family protein